MCWRKIFSLWRFSQSCRISSAWARQFAVCIGTIRRGSNRCSVPRENHSRGVGKQWIPARLFAVLAAIEATCHVYKPGRRWCHKCYTTMDEETRFTSNPDNKPPVSRTTEQKHRLIITDMLVRTAFVLLQGFSESPYQKIKWNWGKRKHTLSKTSVATIK